MIKEKVTQLKNYRTKKCPVCDGFTSIEVISESGKIEQNCDYCQGTGRVPVKEE